MDAVPFASLAAADLTVEAIYQGGTAGSVADDALAALLPVGNQGGFRYAGSPSRGTVHLVALYSSGVNPDWPDYLDPQTGTYTYYGDNREPGQPLHQTRRKGNEILRTSFAAADQGLQGRQQVPPFLLFERVGAVGRSVAFRGLLVPGSPLVSIEEHLVAIWRNRGGDRFQNYRSLFTVLDAARVNRTWLSSILAEAPPREAPPAWTAWVDGGTYEPLLAPATVLHRTRAQQLPTASGDIALLDLLWRHFASEPIKFEYCAAELWRMAAPAVEQIEVTRPSRDGGRDAVGQYALGPAEDRVHLDFALEAKCYQPGNSVGVREVARLISRLRHRQFGVLVTTSFVHEQAYREVRGDAHPVVIMSGADLVRVLKARGLTTPSALNSWLQTRFP